jgi:hypothetical protein
MAYGRLSLSRKHFFEEALLTLYRPDPSPPATLPPARHDTALTRCSTRSIACRSATRP